MTRQQQIESYLSGGWQILPVPAGEKGPRTNEWQTKTFTAGDFRDTDNVGLKCGSVSGNLVDIDLDCEEALKLADAMLPPTGRIHGRQSRPRSHRWYRAEQAKNEVFKHLDGSMIVEMRSNRLQTLIPPSVHPSGEDIIWHEPNDICTYTAEALRRAVAVLAATVLVARHWPSGGSRHECALALAGFLANRKLSPESVEAIVENAAELAGDEEYRDRARAARETVEKRLRGEPVTGGPRLADIVGEEVVTRLRRWLGGEDDQAIEELNERHFIVGVGATMAVGDEDPRHGLPLIQTFGQFRQRYSKQWVTVKVGERAKRVRLPDFWLDHPQGRQYEQLVFAPPPTSSNPKDYNLWRGFAAKRRAGDWSLMKAHLEQIICGGDATAYEYLLGWLALAVQRPGELPEVAIALRGGRGTGKSIFVRAFGSLFGDHFLHLSNSEQLVGKFNAHLAGRVVVFADEAYWAGDKRAESSLKRLITEPTLMIERKGIDAHMEANFTHLILATNNHWSFPAGTDERRVFALRVSDARQQDHDYFGALTAEIENGGREAMLHDLLERSLKDFKVRIVPQTGELIEQKLQTLSPIEQWWYGVLCRGRIGDAIRWPERVERALLIGLAQTEIRGEGLTERGLQTKLGMALEELLPGGVKGQRGASGYWKIPPLVDCRAHFSRRVGGRIDWGEPSKEPALMDGM